MSSTKLYASRIDLKSENRLQLIDLLNLTLALTIALKSQVKQAHWNIKGMSFLELHHLFDSIAEQYWLGFIPYENSDRFKS